MRRWRLSPENSITWIELFKDVAPSFVCTSKKDSNSTGVETEAEWNIILTDPDLSDSQEKPNLKSFYGFHIIARGKLYLESVSTEFDGF